LRYSETVDARAIYLQELRDTGRLTASEEIALAKQVRLGRIAERHAEHPLAAVRARRQRLAAEGQRARNTLVEKNLLLVVSKLGGFVGRGVEELDLIQEGNLGLQRAADRFDYRRGCRFSTYAMFWIVDAMRKAVHADGNAIKVPLYVAVAVRRAMQESDRLYQQLEREPTEAEVRRRAGARSKYFEQAKLAQGVVSLETVHDGTLPFLEIIEDYEVEGPEMAVVRRDYEWQLGKLIQWLVDGLSDHERAILEAYHWREQKVRDIASNMGVSSKRVYAMLNRCYAKLRADIEWLSKAG
jgi:RNA polymerase primary sigma factor